MQAIGHEYFLPEAALKFFVIGDWGVGSPQSLTSAVLSHLAKTMGEMGNEVGYHFHLAVGDNFYPVGVSDVDDPRFKDTFEDICSGYESLFKPWYVMAGNHDYYGNVAAQIAYTKKSPRWIFPDYYYTVRYALTDGTRIDIFIIDTIKLCGNNKTGPFADGLNYRLAPDHGLRGPEDFAGAEKQWQWLECQLMNSVADYVFVAGHYPVYSSGFHGPTRSLVDRLKPLLHQYRVSAYFSGHDHSLEHLNLSYNDWAVDYVVSGAGCMVSQSRAHKHSIPPGSSRFLWPSDSSDSFSSTSPAGKGGIAFVELEKLQGCIKFYDSAQILLHYAPLLPRSRLHNGDKGF